MSCRYFAKVNLSHLLEGRDRKSSKECVGDEADRYEAKFIIMLVGERSVEFTRDAKCNTRSMGLMSFTLMKRTH
jgi:hypothetical protein